MKIALGSMNAAKTAAVRAAARRIAQVDAGWAGAVVITRAVTVSVPAMPLSDTQLMRGSRERAENTCQALQTEGLAADYYIGFRGRFSFRARRWRVGDVPARLGVCDRRDTRFLRRHTFHHRAGCAGAARYGRWLGIKHGH